MNKEKLECLKGIGKNVPAALYESACALSFMGGVLAFPVAGVIYLSGNSETAKQVAKIGGLGVCCGTIGGFFRYIPALIDSFASPIDGYQADLMGKHSLAIERIIGYVHNYREEKKFLKIPNKKLR